MVDISWGELLVLGSVGVALAGRRDLPNACRYAGMQVGRVVGLLQGARARADRFSTQNELKQLQNELRSGLRELDHVKTELVVAASMGRTLGSTTPSANRLVSNKTNVSPERDVGSKFRPKTSLGETVAASVATRDSTTPTSQFVTVHEAKQDAAGGIESVPFSPVIQSERASMEEEWEKQGISFRSIAEQGTWMNDSNGQSPATNEGMTGSEILDRIMQQNLVFDQYDRVVSNQEHELEQRIKDIETKGRGKGGGPSGTED